MCACVSLICVHGERSVACSGMETGVPHVLLSPSKDAVELVFGLKMIWRWGRYYKHSSQTLFS